MSLNVGLKEFNRNPKRKFKKLYGTKRGRMYWGTAEQFLESPVAKRAKGKVNLIFTSPPFPLNRKKKYGNFQGQEYVDWLAGFAEGFRDLLSPDGSIVMELGNAWERGKPVMSTLALKALIQFMEEGHLTKSQKLEAEKRKQAEELDLRRVKLPRTGEVLGLLEQRLGGSRCKIRCFDGKTRICRIPGRMKRYLWVREGDIVLVEPWEFGGDEKGDIIFKYKKNQVDFLKKKGLLKDLDDFDDDF